MFPLVSSTFKNSKQYLLTCIGFDEILTHYNTKDIYN